MRQFSLNGSQLKIIALIAMTMDHIAWAIWPGYPRQWYILAIHGLGRLAAPVFWYFIVEGYFHTRNFRRYASRLFVCALVGHFAYNFAFGIPFLPFQTSVFNQTSVLWSLFWGLMGLWVCRNDALRQWQKVLLVMAIAAVSFCADWSSVAVMAILEIGEHRGSFRRQMVGMMAWILVYAVIYSVFLDAVYGALQVLAVFAVPLLRRYNGQRGSLRGTKWLFYWYYPLHLVFCGLLRLAMHGGGTGI